MLHHSYTVTSIATSLISSTWVLRTSWSTWLIINAKINNPTAKSSEASIMWPGNYKKKRGWSAINDWLQVRFSAGIKYSVLLNNRDARRSTLFPSGWDTTRGASKPEVLTHAYPKECAWLYACVSVLASLMCQSSIMQILGCLFIKALRRVSVLHYTEMRTCETDRSVCLRSYNSLSFMLFPICML